MQTSISFNFFFLPQEHDRDIKQLVRELSSMSLEGNACAGVAPEVKHKLEDLFKTRNIMKFNSHASTSEKESSPFSAEEIALLQNIPKGMLFPPDRHVYLFIFNLQVDNSLLICSA